jgi:hypothetical protein
VTLRVWLAVPWCSRPHCTASTCAPPSRRVAVRFRRPPPGRSRRRGSPPPGWVRDRWWICAAAGGMGVRPRGHRPGGGDPEALATPGTRQSTAPKTRAGAKVPAEVEVR